MSDEPDTTETSDAKDDRRPFAAIADALPRIDEQQRAVRAHRHPP
jgi:hypothetical protein